ncbi:hypothetical protein L5515_018237 [Caenorhabditis briggsae]|uniref:Uncharacterized protein n=2 Tax=Caenorhabditis briggsae TaxID=6238 RepID=A0AAE8ZSB1_CAEBR|nr:hypothetical protein L3Y34_012382 [Caenorhabditis briggsae]UMM42391.1 hypothetical protein L5515_018237 [Caenorhabditis briggsae]
MTDEGVEKLEKSLGKLKLDFPTSIITKSWQKSTYQFHRDSKIEQIIEAFYSRKTNGPNRRLKELEWFARKLEAVLYDYSTSREVYEDGIDACIRTMKNMVQTDPELKKIAEAKGIPPTEMLESIFKIDAEREDDVDEEDDLMAEGATVINLVSPDRFRHTKFDLRSDKKEVVIKSEVQRKPIQGVNNRRIARAHYTRPVPVEDEMTMTFTLEPLNIPTVVSHGLPDEEESEDKYTDDEEKEKEKNAEEKDKKKVGAVAADQNKK